MFDGISAKVWILVAIGTVALPAARFVHRYVTQSPRYHDITQPVPDFGWRTRSALYKNVALLLALGLFAGFVFTPEAETFARSVYFAPSLLLAIAVFALVSVVIGLRTGRAAPLIKGFSAEFMRDTQPKRFWASLGWNGMVAVALLFFAATLVGQWDDERCFGPIKNASALSANACTKLMARAENDRERADLLRQRALVRYGMGDLRGSLEDYRAILAVEPTDVGALSGKGAVYLALGKFADSARTLTEAATLAPDDPWILANRGLAYAWMGERTKARADFARVRETHPADITMLHGEALMAFDENDFPLAIDRLDRALAENPRDGWALNQRAEVYWAMGLEAKSETDRHALAVLVAEYRD